MTFDVHITALLQIIITCVGVKIIKPCLDPGETGAGGGAGVCMTARAGHSTPARPARPGLSISVALGPAQSQDM